MYLLCEDYEENNWGVISCSHDRAPLDQEALRLNELDYDKCLRRYLSDNRYPEPLKLDDPKREGYMKFYVHEVPLWPERFA